MLKLINELPVELVGTNVLGYLCLQDIIMLERASASKESHQLFLSWIPYGPSFVFPSDTEICNVYLLILNWFMKRQCALTSIKIRLPCDNPDLTKLRVIHFDLAVYPNTTMESCKSLIEKHIECKVRSINIKGYQKSEVIERLSSCTRNVELLTLCPNNCMEWLTADVLSRWRLKTIILNGFQITTPLVSLIVKTCFELTYFELQSDNMGDDIVIPIAQYCHKLETLVLISPKLTWSTLLTLSKRGLPLEELEMGYFPSIPNVDIAMHCSHALSRIRYISTSIIYKDGQDTDILIAFMTGLTSVRLNHHGHYYIPMLTKHCTKLTEIEVEDEKCLVEDIMSLCQANPLLKAFKFYSRKGTGITDTILIKLIHACPHLHTLELSHETTITDMGILALSDHCQGIQRLLIDNCHKVTETAILQLLQSCHQLTRLNAPSSSLPEKSWRRLDRNFQRRVTLG